MENSKEEDNFAECNEIPSPSTNFQEQNQQENVKPEEEEILSEEEITDIKQQIAKTKTEAGGYFTSGDYLSAVNLYSTCISLAEKIKFKEQLSVLNCNRGICFLKLKDTAKSIESFSKALEYDSKYPKALANRMLLLKDKEEYIEALEDFNKLKEADEKLWNNYRYMEYELNAKAEIKKKQMTDEMLGKLKDLGNSLLGNFGISLDNFKLTPNGSGGYSVQYQK